MKLSDLYGQNLANHYSQVISNNPVTRHSVNNSQDNSSNTDKASAVKFDTFGGRTDKDYTAWRKHTERNFVFLNWDDRKYTAYLPTPYQSCLIRTSITIPLFPPLHALHKNWSFGVLCCLTPGLRKDIQRQIQQLHSHQVIYYIYYYYILSSLSRSRSHIYFYY